MRKAWLLMIAGWSLMLSAWADEPLRQPLSFISSDSIVVWGEDRSDFRTSALAIAPELQPRLVEVEQIDRKVFRREMKAWKKEVLPSINILGVVEDAQGQVDILPTAAIVEKAGSLFLQTADSRYMDVLERTALNGLMRVAAPGELSFEKHVAARALMDASGMVYATDAAGLFVNLYTNSSTHIKNRNWDFVVDQLTAMPHSGRVKIRISALKKGLTPMKIRLRMPGWAYQNWDERMSFLLEGIPQKLPVIYVNGREEFYHLENGYLVVDRRWNSGDEIYFDFPMHLQYLHPANKGKCDYTKVMLQRGPLVYGIIAPSEDLVLIKEHVNDNEENTNAFGHSLFRVTVSNREGQKQKKEIGPVMDGADFRWMTGAEK